MDSQESPRRDQEEGAGDGLSREPQERSRGGRWSWTLKRAQERSRGGRWSWTLPGEIKRREVELDSQEDSQQLWPSSSVLVKMWFNNSVFDRLSSSVISKFVSATLSVPDNGLSSSVLLKVCLNNSVCA